MSTRPLLPIFDPFTVEFRTDPFPTWAASQARAPIFYYPEMNFWVPTRFDDVMAAVTDHETFSSRAVGTVPVPESLASPTFRHSRSCPARSSTSCRP